MACRHLRTPTASCDASQKSWPCRCPARFRVPAGGTPAGLAGQDGPDDVSQPGRSRVRSAGLAARRSPGSCGPIGPGWIDELACAEVLRLGQKRPARVLVRFCGQELEGREEWVPPSRLKVAWEGRRGLPRTREEQWNRIHAAGVRQDDPREDAAETCAGLLFGDGEVAVIYRGSGSVQIRGPASLAARLGLDEGQLAGHPLAFTEDGLLIAPWEVTELVMATAARQNPGPVLEHVASEERTARREAIHGSWLRGARGRGRPLHHAGALRGV